MIATDSTRIKDCPDARLRSGFERFSAVWCLRNLSPFSSQVLAFPLEENYGSGSVLDFTVQGHLHPAFVAHMPIA